MNPPKDNPRSSAAAHNDGALVADVPTLPGDAPEQAGAAQRDLARAGIDNEYASAAAGLRRAAAQAAGRAA